VNKPVLLDLFSGAGGCARGYQDAGFYVIGVDKVDQPRYAGDEFVIGDALDWLRTYLEDGVVLGHEIAAIHASPPCQAHSDLAHHPQNRGNDYPELISPTRDLLLRTGLPYVIENVPGAPLINPTMLCGSAFGLGVKRHRLFETSFPMMSPGCAHGGRPKRFKVWRHGKEIVSAFVPVYGTGGGKAAEHWNDAMGVDWMTRRELSQAIPPAFTEHIGSYLPQAIQLQKAAA
jgi:DNA (cytosine-5)-methyltransferase 1